MREFWKTGAALLVLAALGSYIWFVERKREPGAEEKKEAVLTLDKERAREVTLAAPGQDTIRLVKDGSSWRVSAPFAAPADGSAVDTMLGSLTRLEAQEVVVETTQDLSQYGLDAPSRTVSVVVDGETEPKTVEFGAKTPGDTAVYARTPASPRVFTVATWALTSFDKKPFDLRDRDLLHVKRDDVRTIEVTGPEGRYTLARTDAGEWAFTKPLQTRAGRWSVDGLIGTLENLRMEQVAAEEATDLGPFGLGRPSRSVLLVLKDGTTRALEIGGRAGTADEGKYHARERGNSLVAVIPGTLVADLEKGMGELRAKKLLEVATYDTEGFEVKTGDVTKTFAKSTVKDDDGFDKTQWQRTAPEEKDLETTKVEDALFKLGGVEVKEFIDRHREPAAYGFDTPILALTVRAKSESSVTIGKKGDDYFARRTADDSVLALDRAKAEELVKALEEL